MRYGRILIPACLGAAMLIYSILNLSSGIPPEFWFVDYTTGLIAGFVVGMVSLVFLALGCIRLVISWHDRPKKEFGPWEWRDENEVS